MHYYEEEFLHFEKFADLTDLKPIPGQAIEDPSEFILEKFANYEKWLKKDCLQQWRKYCKRQNKLEKRGIVQKTEKVSSGSEGYYFFTVFVSKSF